eukprot:gene49214-56303_t
MPLHRCSCHPYVTPQSARAVMRGAAASPFPHRVLARANPSLRCAPRRRNLRAGVTRVHRDCGLRCVSVRPYCGVLPGAVVRCAPSMPAADAVVVGPSYGTFAPPRDGRGGLPHELLGHVRVAALVAAAEPLSGDEHRAVAAWVRETCHICGAWRRAACGGWLLSGVEGGDASMGVCVDGPPTDIDAHD